MAQQFIFGREPAPKWALGAMMAFLKYTGGIGTEIRTQKGMIALEDGDTVRRDDSGRITVKKKRLSAKTKAKENENE